MGLEFTPTPITEYLDFYFAQWLSNNRNINGHLEGEFSHNVKCDTIVIDLMGSMLVYLI